MSLSGVSPFERLVYAQNVFQIVVERLHQLRQFLGLAAGQIAYVFAHRDHRPRYEHTTVLLVFEHFAHSRRNGQQGFARAGDPYQGNQRHRIVEQQIEGQALPFVQGRDPADGLVPQVQRLQGVVLMPEATAQAFFGFLIYQFDELIGVEAALACMRPLAFSSTMVSVDTVCSTYP